jgi:hypothetical protein
LALFLGGLVLLLAFVPGVAVVRLVVLHPFELIERAVNQEPNALFILIMVFAGIATGLWQFWFRRGARPPLRRLLYAAAMVVTVPAVLIGSVIWIESADFNYLVLILARSALLFSVLWLARALPPLVASAVSRPLHTSQGVAMGLAGTAIAVATASVIATLRGAELDQLDSTHMFYIWIMPALVGFGWGAPRPEARSPLFAGAGGLLTVLMWYYAVPVHFLDPSGVECYFPYEQPRHVAYWFEFEPWRWNVEGPYVWLATPGGLAELTLRHIWQPLIGFTCTGTGDLPSELLPKPWQPNS